MSGIAAEVALLEVRQVDVDFAAGSVLGLSWSGDRLWTAVTAAGPCIASARGARSDARRL